MNLTTEEIITELSMTYSFKMHLIVEGDDDRRFFRSVIKGKESVNVLCAWGAENVMKVILEVEKLMITERIVPTLGIIDRDYRIPLGTMISSPNLISSDSRDIECMMFGSPSLDAVLAEFGSETKIAALGGATKIAHAACIAGKTVGRIRYHAQQLQKGTSFRKLELAKLVDRKTLALEPIKLLKHLNAQQGATGCALPAKAFEQAIEACDTARCERGLTYFQNDLLLCRGHDLMEILAIGFRFLFGSRSATESSRENVESLFRLNYTAHFKATPMAQAIDNWLVRNLVYPPVALV
jgi:Protein of unknown function (DUF4435)